jgi:signal transduction histidine kinase
MKCFIHELKTPIQTIDLGLQCFEVECPECTSKETFQDIKMSVEFLKEVVQNFSIAQSQQIKLNEFEPYSLMLLLTNTIAVIPNDELYRNVKLNTSIESNVIDINYIDESHLKQVLLNLIKNSIKYQTKNRRNIITIRISKNIHLIRKLEFLKGNSSVKNSTKNTQNIKIEVIDNNDHLLPHIKDHLFETFNSTSGSGLGLYIARTIIELHGGSISHEHVYPLGNKFIINLTLTYIANESFASKRIASDYSTLNQK